MKKTSKLKIIGLIAYINNENKFLLLLCDGKKNYAAKLRSSS